MAYYGIYGTYRPSGSSGTISNKVPKKHTTLPAKGRYVKDDLSPGKYSSRISSGMWQDGCLYPAIKREISVDRQYGNRFLSVSPARYGVDYHRERSPVRRPMEFNRQSKLSPDFRPRGFIPPSRNTVWTNLSLRYPKTTRYDVRESSVILDRSYTPYRDSSKLPQVQGWRARLAQQGYVASTTKKNRCNVPERKWNYLDVDEMEEMEDNFIFVTSCGTCDESSEQRDSVISRSRRMKLQKLTEVAAVSHTSVEVDTEDLNQHIEEEKKREKRSFISSRHQSWYSTGSYNRYVSPMPWRGSFSSRYPSADAESVRMQNQELESTLPEEVIHERANKDFRKSALNVDLPQCETQLFATRQADFRWRRTVDDSCYTSEDGSPSETGYDSSCTDAERSSGETDGFFTDSYGFSEDFRASSYISSPRSTPFDCEQHFLDVMDEPEGLVAELRENFDSQIFAVPEANKFPDLSLDLGEKIDSQDTLCSSDSNDCSIKNIDELCIRFRSLNEESSQRDSGFAEICDSPAIQHDLDECAVFRPNVESKSSFIGVCNDIDQLLMDTDLDSEAFRTFEDFERKIQRQKSNIRANRNCDFNCSSSNWSKPSKVGLHLDIDACTKFIGTCHDIDEMLGQPTPLSPDSESTTVLSEDKFLFDEAIGSTTANSDVADLNWLSDYEQDTQQRTTPKEWPDKTSLENHLDDCTLQLYRYNGSEGDYGNYLDLESTIDEQAEDFEDFHANRKNAIILRTQLSVRVHVIIEKLLNSSGRELRRALFSLKQIFQDDKDLVHEFVQSDGLACLVKVGSEADQNYQNYILRALGQVMLYVDGMNGVIDHIETIQWLYSLIASKYRLVVKTALKLLLVFVEYSDSNSQLLMNTVCVVDSQKGTIPWSNIMNLLKEKDSADMELLVYAVTLINKTLNGIPDQDTYYDIVDSLEEQGMENVIQYYMSKQGTDLDLLQQFQIYEAVLKQEDDVPDTKPIQLDARFRQVPRSRKSISDECDRRKSRRHSVGTVNNTPQTFNKSFHSRSLENTPEESAYSWQDRNQNHVDTKRMNGHVNGHINGNGECDISHDMNGITPALRRRRERDARNKSLIKEQEETGRGTKYQRSDSLSSSSTTYSGNSENSSLVKECSKLDKHRSRFENHVEHENRKNNELTQLKEEKNSTSERNKLNDLNRPNNLPYGLNNNHKKSWMLSMMYSKSQEEGIKSPTDTVSTNGVEIVNNNYIVYSKKDDMISNCNLNNLMKDNNVKDMQDKFVYHNGENGIRSPTSDIAPRIGDPSGIISRAKEGLAASKLRPELRPTSPLSPNSFIQKADSDVQWDNLINSVKRPLIINDLDFTDLRAEEDIDLLESLDGEVINELNGGPPPLPPGLGPPPPPPPLPSGVGPIPPPPLPQIIPNKCGLRLNGTDSSSQPSWIKRNQQHSQGTNSKESSKGGQKTKKTVKLFWREVKEDRSLLKRIGRKKTIWDELKPVPVDTQKLEHLFENRAKDLLNKEKSQDSIKKSEIIVLDTKRSNAINIGMTKLPPPRTIKTAILKMDSTIMNREGIEKILTMLPTEDEKAKIAEAQMTNPDVPLGTAEQFLLTLSSISELEARLRLWAFRLDYESMEREVAEPLMDLKQAIKEIESSETLRVILSTLRAVGNFLNGVEIKGFHIEYLSKVPEVKDTVQKHSLLHHLCHIVMEKFPKSSDLYSEIGSVTRASKIDYGEVTKSLNKMESECKASWDYLKAILKHDCNITMKVRTTEFLSDCAERIIVLKVIHRRMINRYHKFLVYLGCSSQSIEELPIQKCCRILSEFALEYRTTRERVLQQIEKKANHRERNKTRGKMITDMEKFKTKEQQADQELRQLLGSPSIYSDEHKTQKWGTVPGVRGRIRPNLGPGGSLGRHSAPVKEDHLTDADDEILETLVKTATTQSSRSEPRIRKKARYGDRKSLRRTLKGGLELSEEERNMLSSLTT